MAGEPSGSQPDKTGVKFDPLRPDMPNIPGLGEARRHSTLHASLGSLKRSAQIFGVVLVASVMGIAVAWGVFKAARRVPTFRAASPAPPAAASNAPQAAPDSIPSLNDIMGPTHVAESNQLSKPWSAKKFQFVKPFTREAVDAMAIRLPGGELWAFALHEPYGQCELDFITNLRQLARQYDYHATHPMVVSPCDRTVYDPLTVGSAGGGIWSRGAIVQGDGLRPPFAIDVRQKGRLIIADRME
jgi:hypothetical protein